MLSSLRKKYGQLITSGAQIGIFAIAAESKSLKGWLVCLALMALISLCAWISTMRRRHAITNTPTSRIASAAQGYVELIGVGKPLDGGPPVLSLQTRQPCLWYRYRMADEEKTVYDESDAPFIVDDGSGRCVVDVEGAEITTRHKKTWSAGKRSYTEWKLLIDDDIYALGEFKTFGGGSVDLDARRDMGELLDEWKKDRKTLLERFDLDKDGELNEKEWGLACQAARREVSKMHIEARNESDVHTLSAPGDGRHYLISNIDPKRLAHRYLLWSLFHMAIFLSVLGAIPWVLHQQTRHETIKAEREAELQRRVQEIYDRMDNKLPSSSP